MTKEETMKVIAEGVRREDICPIVEEIAKQAAEYFEMAAEWHFERDEDIPVFDLMMRLYGAGLCMEAVDLLMTVFSLVGMEDAMAIVGIVAVACREEVYQMFMQCFTEHSERCEMHCFPAATKGRMN